MPNHDKHDIGCAHFIGIGGIGMSAIAEVMHHHGVHVQGSDLGQGANVERLKKKGIEIFSTHAAAHIAAADRVIYSSAITADNAELAAARARGVPILHRADQLAELMRAKKSIAVSGTHGKTTTTALIAAILEAAALDPTVINGGIIHAYGSNARCGAGDWMIVEADESDGSFTDLPADMAIITNIDRDHLDHYGGLDALSARFLTFIENVPPAGAVILSADDEAARRLAQKTRRHVMRFGLNGGDVMGRDIVMDKTGMRFALCAGGAAPMAMHLPLCGAHNVQNALAAAAAALALEIAPEVIAKALAGFSGVARRFSLLGSYRGAAIYDDYAHHPAEIAATLKTARALCSGRVIAIVQPHRYSRLAALFDDFTACMADADIAVIAPVYAAGEAKGAVDAGALADALVKQGAAVERIADAGDLAPLLDRHARPGDMVIGMGAGSIGAWMKGIAQC